MALDDAKRGLALLQTRSGEFGFNARRIGIMGFSAGGHLAARLASGTRNATTPDFMILIYPAYLEKEGKLLDEVVPPDVPVFAYVASDDEYSPSARAFAAYCKDKGIRCQYFLAENGGHGFGIKQPLPDGVKDWPEKLRAFLEDI